MSVKFGWFDIPLGGDPTKHSYSADQMRDLFRSMLTNGIIPQIRQTQTNNIIPTKMLGNALSLHISTGLNINIDKGTVFIDGAYLIITEPESLTLVAGRINDIVVRLDKTGSDIVYGVFVKQRGANSIELNLIREGGIYELGIYSVDIKAGTTQVTQNMITDHRLNMKLGSDNKPCCGIVGSLLMPDIDDWYKNATNEQAEWLESSQTAFKEWFKSIQDVLDENTASNLLNLINKLETQKADKTYVDSVVNSCVKTQAVKSGTSVLSPTLTTGNWFGTFKDLSAEFFPDGQAFLKTEVYAGDEAVLGWRKLTACCPHHDLTMEAVCINSVWQPWHKIYTSSRIRIGTGGPSGGFNGDIYIKHT